jgi:hypothetical protein
MLVVRLSWVRIEHVQREFRSFWWFPHSFSEAFSEESATSRRYTRFAHLALFLESLLHCPFINDFVTIVVWLLTCLFLVICVCTGVPWTGSVDHCLSKLFSETFISPSSFSLSRLLRKEWSADVCYLKVISTRGERLLTCRNLRIGVSTSPFVWFLPFEAQAIVGFIAIHVEKTADEVS